MDRHPLIAVVGMDGIFPGAPNLDVFWQNIVNGIDQSAPVPESRWIAPSEDRLSTTLVPDRPYSRHACLIHDFSFDPGAFKLDPELTRHLDPFQQLTLTAGKRAFHNCVTDPVDYHRIDTILAAIALPTDSASAFSRQTLGRAIEHRLFPHGPTAPAAVTRIEGLASRVDGLPAALLAAEMGFGGDCFTLDAACASSIYAVNLGCNALAANRADLVVTGGVSRPECLYTQTGFSQLQALSASGRCSPFDKRADGLVVGEGVGILVLKRLADALEHGDTIHGVIHGVGLSNDMRGNLLAPESRGQVRAMEMAYRSAGWQPTDVDHIECHGTGTRAGDTTEIQSLVQLWKGTSPDAGVCAIGSVKSMIGHLLTAAGAAGMIKTLLAIKHQTLPTSINYEQCPSDSPLKSSPFRVQTQAAPWKSRAADIPRRAAVSAFGFGGINAHILLEEWLSHSSAEPSTGFRRSSVHEKPAAESPEPVAIVGMDVTLGALTHLKLFEKAVLQGNSTIADRPSGRWKGADATFVKALGGFNPKGGYIDSVAVGIGEFQIPPNEINDILPQQLLALKVGAGAMTDAGLPLREPRNRMGVVIGLGFDFEATNFHLRWQLFRAIRRWNLSHGLNMDDRTMDQWMQNLREQCGPPLTPQRVMGALGGIVASRMAREFRFGGPSFVVSADAASGVKALQVAVDLLQQNTADAMLVGAVDLAAEGRSVVRMDHFLPLSRTNTVRPFDASADGTLPGDGAVALVLKPLAQARIDGNRIYAVIRGIGSAGGDNPSTGSVKASTYCRSLSRCFNWSGVSADAVSYVEAHAAGIPNRDRMEIAALADFFSNHGQADPSAAVALGSTKPITGFTGAADSLASLAKTALCLHHRILPPFAGFTRLPDLPEGLAKETNPFHLPDHAQHWYRDRKCGPRTACCASITQDGNCSHVLLQEYEDISPTIESAGPAPVIDTRAGLFVVTGQTPRQLIEGLSRMEVFLSRTHGQVSVESTAGRWLKIRPPEPGHQLAVALILKPGYEYSPVLNQARRAITSGESDPFSKQVFFNSQPIGAEARMAMVYPGSGNHYLSMGRDLALLFPSIVNGMDRETERLKTQFRPWNLMPWRRSWQSGWEGDAISRLNTDPLNMIFGQVVFGDLMTRVLDRFSIRADAVIGYSLGESAALFAQGVWLDRGDMLDRMQSTDLFATQLSGPCLSLRRAWQISENEPVVWQVAVVNRPKKYVQETLASIPRVRLLIVNSPSECVIGGLEKAVAQAVTAMDCQAVFLDGVVTVHCDAAGPVADAYRRLHLFPTISKPGVDVYSCSWAATYEVTSDRAADSIVKQAVEGFDFTQTIKRAYADGVRVFIEAGPRASCTRMIDQILIDQPHLAVAANHGSENEIASLLRCLARLAAERVPMDLNPLYAGLESASAPNQSNERKIVLVPVGGHMLSPRLPELLTKGKPHKPLPPAFEKLDGLPKMSESIQPVKRPRSPSDNVPSSGEQWTQLLETSRQNMETTASAHQQFLDLSRDLIRNFAETFDLQTRLLEMGARLQDDLPQEPITPGIASPAPPSPPAFDREMCMAFAIGSVGRVLGPAFDVVDTYRVRVRLPDEPLMLVDRIVSLEGKMLSMESGRVVTEHDVLPGAWYLDGDRAPVCISVEAGQADLFLSAYLGIDHQVKGERAYRLLDAVVIFHRELPRPGEIIRYEITIDRFVRQGETWMFFFRFEGYIGGEHLISMRDGCAGFFTKAEVANSGGIILTKQECAPVPGKCPPDWQPPVPMTRESYSENQVDALRRGDLAACFGRQFSGIGLSDSLFLPGGRMRLIHRIMELDPQGGRYGLGLIRAEADIRPDDWFLVCHFVDDMVMPGTLMYECCAHTLRVFLQRLGWVTDKPGVCYEPVIGNAARLKCRGPVTPATRHVHYEIQISEIGYGPEPYVIADAHMSADGRPIVFFKDMSMKMTGTSREEIETVWRERKIRAAMVDEPTPPADALYDRASILAFAVGKPSEAFGEPYRIFDEGRKIARLPGPPYCFMDRVIQVEPAPWTLKADGWMTAQYDIPEKEWYFSADRSGVMPFCVLLEIALQPCGWLAAYAGSALRSQRDLKFRNLGGSAVLHRQVTPGTGTLTMRCRMTKVSEAADMIIENFDYEVLAGDDPVYTGDTYFGFFSAEALNEQKGMGQADPMVQSMLPYSDKTDGAFTLSMAPPHTPESASGMAVSADELALPGKALMMIDRIDACFPKSGESGLGYIRGVKKVDPDEWFFKAHFHQDPVCPGSLGIESFLQLMKTVTMQRWPHLAATHRFRMVEGCRHGWTYRGQIVPKNRTIVVEALITHVTDGLSPSVRANGLLSVDGLPIYKMENFELALVSAADNSCS
ncbi:beta-ketoacyl synthase N-terminal-like domain-containing protein [uncultured Desulfosarcina sp.]|uniref:beta-ketoacyl synthase N-terminal-like domain-containing protein n=1 Tax=uncultured Desulfosarcina sp. TaxID=218289 RepID=UPI0029C8C896|nr:beta-ketoacyl synthase N-terminal-like domain-containing protein [uncultured Desulfosarcina sp.]